MEGWIKLHRQILNWEHFNEPTIVVTFLALLSIAYQQDKTVKGVRIKRGECYCSLSDLSAITFLSRKTIIKALKALSDSGEITHKQGDGSNKSFIKINNYKKYQDVKNSGVLSGGNFTPPNINKNDLRKKEINEDTDVSSSKSKPVSTPRLPVKDLYSKYIDFFNETTKGVFGTVRLPLSEKRKSMLRGRITEHGEDAFFRVVELAMQSSFLKGQNGRGWATTFDWLIKPTNFEKVLSGNYTDRPSLFQQPQNKNGKVAPMQAFENMMQKFAGQQKPQTTEDIDFETIG